MKQQLEQIRRSAMQDLDQASDPAALPEDSDSAEQ